MGWFVRAEHAQTTPHPELLRCYTLDLYPYYVVVGYDNNAGGA